MKTTVRTEKLVRWKGTVGDTLKLAERASESITEDTGATPSCFVKVTLATRETNFDRLSDFETSVHDDLGQVEGLELTVGDFLHDSPLSVKIEFRKSRADPAVTIRGRGHNPRLVDGLVAELTKQATHGRRGLPLSMSAISWIALGVYLVAQFVFFQTVELPAMSELVFYLALLLISFLPFVFLSAVVRTMNWLVPVLEMLPPGAGTRWERLRLRVFAAVGGLITLVVAPVIVAVISERL